MQRRDFFYSLIAGSTLAQFAQSQPPGPQAGSGVYFERSLAGQPHKGKVLLAIQAHSDDIPFSSAGTVSKLIEEGYTGYLVRATNDDMGDSPGLGKHGTISENALGNERDTEKVAQAMGCVKVFNLNYSNHRMADVSVNEVISRLILIIRLVRANTVVCWDPWAHDEENPDHYTIAKATEAACWMAGRDHDYEEQYAAGLKPQEVTEKYYYARRPEINRVVDISKQIDKKIEAIRSNVWKGPGGHYGAQLRADLAKRHERLPMLGDDDATADHNYIKEFFLGRDRELGKQYGVEFAEAFHYIPPGASGADLDPRIEKYVREHVVPEK